MTPAGTETLTFLYTDIEGSTRLWQQHPQAMPGVVARHDELLREIVAAHGGRVFRTMGDAVCAAFRTASDGLAAAQDGQRALLSEPWENEIGLRVRMAIHTGATEMRDGDYVGHTLNRVARLLASGNGGQILLSDVTQGLLLDELPADVTLRDLGEHRLKDLDRPEHIYQVDGPGLLGDLPPLRTLDTVPTNLPVQTTSFVGRELEVERVTTLLRQQDVRLLTLLGPGGAGKTRLALHIGTKLLDAFADGVFFVPLAQIQDPRVVAPTIASALSIRESGESSTIERLTNYLRSRETLLILDNFEQVLSAAQMLATLLSASSHVTILVTSRSVLHLTAEHEYAVPSLSFPDPAHLPSVDSLTQYDAVTLFVQRARAIKPKFSVTNANAPAVAEICSRLEGLPLAIELAAARIRLFPPEALLKRLSNRLSMLTGGSRDLPARQQTLRGTIDWSYSLLSPGEQRLFTRLAVFAGSWSLEAAEEVCDIEGDLDVLGGIAALVEQSLVRQDDEAGDPCFTMLETIREYATERLAASAETESLRRRHAQWYLARFRDVPSLMADVTVIIRDLPSFVSEQDNLRAAAQWSLAVGDWTEYAILLSPLCIIWFTQGWWTEAASWIESDAAAIPPEKTMERALVLYAAGFFLHRVGEYDCATEHLEEAITILRELGQKRELSTALYILGELLTTRGRREAAWSVLEESLAASRETSHENTPMILTYLGILARERGDFSGARRFMEEGLQIARHFNHVSYSAVALNGLADLSRLEGDYERAGAMYLEVAGMAEGAAVIFTRPGQLHNLAYVAHYHGDDAKAHDYFAEALNLYRNMGDRRGVAECVAGLAVLNAGTDPAKAARLLSAAMAAAAAMGSHLSSSNQGEYERALSVIHTHLDDSRFQSSWEAGKGTTLDAAVAEVVTSVPSNSVGAFERMN